MVREWHTTKAAAPQRLSKQWLLLANPAYGHHSKMPHRSCSKRPLLSKWQHYNISSACSLHVSCKSCSLWCTTFPPSEEAASEKLSTMVTPFLPQLTAFKKHHGRSCPWWWHLLSILHPHLSSPTEMTPQQN